MSRGKALALTQSSLQMTGEVLTLLVNRSPPLDFRAGGVGIIPALLNESVETGELFIYTAAGDDGGFVLEEALACLLWSFVSLPRT